MCDGLAAKDSAPTPNATSPMQLLWCNSGINWFQKIFTFFIFRKQHTSIFQLESIQCLGATRHLTKMLEIACGSCAKTAMMLGWRNYRGRKQVRERNLHKEEGKNHVQGDLEGIEWLFAAQGMKLIFIVWNWMKTSVG